MPFSHNRFDQHMRTIIRQSGCLKWLDIGVGSGKFGKMLKDMLSGIHVTGVEINLEYIDKFSLTKKYDKVRPINAMKLMQEPENNYDGIILGDVLEHMPKSQGVDLVNFLVYRCQIMIIIYPLARIQNGWQGFDHEAHISVWGEQDWQNFEYIIIDDPASHLVIVDGFIEHEGIDINVLV